VEKGCDPGITEGCEEVVGWPEKAIIYCISIF